MNRQISPEDNRESTKDGVGLSEFSHGGRMQDETTPKQAESCGEMVSAWPKTTILIIGNEFCERFSYYGMRTILVFYLFTILKFDEDLSTMVNHAFIFWAYFTPILGMILADGYIGKFHTILWVSILYAAGQILWTVGSTFDGKSSVHPWVDIAGLFIIGLGTGGIKPCVSAFGGDQFDPSQLKLIAMYFSAFYFAINAGAMMSTIMTPKLRAIPCLDNDSCFPLAFGVPAVLMVVATVFFLVGSFWYKKKPPKENVIFMVVAVTFRALTNKLKSKSATKDHWLDHYMSNHSCATDIKCQQNKCHKEKFVEGLKGVYRVLVMFIPVPVFWSLFDQTSSRWIIQGVAMNGRIWEDGLNVPPDQMQVANAFLILLMIPIFQIVIYPLVGKCGIKVTPLRKMAFGGFLSAVSYLVVGLVQLKVNDTNPIIPEPGKAHFTIINAVPKCAITAKGPFEGNIKAQSLKAMGKDETTPVELDLSKKLELTFEYGAGCPLEGRRLSFDAAGKIEERNSYYIVFGVEHGHKNISMAFSKVKLEKSRKGNGASTINLNSFVSKGRLEDGLRVAFCKYEDIVDKDMPCDPRQADEFVYVTFCAVEKDKQPEPTEESKCSAVSLSSTSTDLREGKWRAYIVKQNARQTESDGVDRTISAETFKKEGYIVPKEFIAEFDVAGQGAVSSLTLYEDDDGKNTLFSTYFVPKNGLTILWQLIPYSIITTSEILFSITGLEFSYSQSPRSLKSFMTACWLFTGAIGNIIIMIVIELKLFENLAHEMFFYAVMMTLVMIVFSALAIFYYEYTYYTETDEDDDVA